MNRSEPTGMVFDIKRYAIHDGPGIRTTLFLKGCPIRCLWCANPESQSTTPQIAWVSDNCIGCGQCALSCPQGAVSFEEHSRRFDRKACKACGQCVADCPADAIERMGRTVTVLEIFNEICSDRIFWDRSGGGLTLSGGEPLQQACFSKALLKRCKDEYIHTALDTCLYAPSQILQEILPYVDYFLCDLKIMDAAKHRQFTGSSNALIRENLILLLQSEKEVLVRIPLIPGINDDRDNLEALARFLISHRPDVSVEILPYHPLGQSKYERLGMHYALEDVTPPTQDQLKASLNILRSFGLKPVKT